MIGQSSEYCVLIGQDVDNVLMYLGISTRLTETERNTIVPLLIKGFKDAARESGARLTGGQTVFNPWLMMGGCATSICSPEVMSQQSRQ